MPINRRQLLTGAAALGAAGLTSQSAAAVPGAGSLAAARADFPWAANETYLNCALEHPLGLHSSDAMSEYIGYLTHGPDSGRAKYENVELQERVRQRFARLIGATPAEIAFVPSTQIAENLVLDGLRIQESGGNVVTNDLHYGGSLSNYRARKERGLDARIIKHKDYTIDIRDWEAAIDRRTKLVSLALVSNINGYLDDIRAISDIAHAHGAVVFVDVIQAAGAVPIDVRAMGIDLLACSAYKWLMGGRFGYLYVAEELHDGALQPVQFGSKGSGAKDARQYQVSTPNHVGFVCQHEALAYILKLSVENIRAHVRPLTRRLRAELPAAGYACITPPGNQSPIVSFLVPDVPRARTLLSEAGVIVSLGNGSPGRMRVSPSVFNNLADVDRLIDAMV
jgi:selenocysteine lyase/cysteine desulfurase